MQGLVTNLRTTSAFTLSNYSSGATMMKKRVANLPGAIATNSVQGMASSALAILIGGDTMVSYDSNLTIASYSTGAGANWRAGAIYHGAAGYFMLGGGSISGVLQTTVHTWNGSLTKGTATPLGIARNSPATATIGNYALFCTGDTGSGIGATQVDAYDASMVRTTPTAASWGSCNAGAATIGGYAIIGGGWHNGGYTSVVNSYNSSLTRGIPTAFSASRNAVIGASNSSLAIFGSFYTTGVGRDPGLTAYNSSLTMSTPTPLTIGRDGMGCVGKSDYVMFFAGRTGTMTLNTTEFYDASATRILGPGTTEYTYTSQETSATRGTVIGPYFIVGGGSTYYGSFAVDAFFMGVRVSIPKGTTYAITGGPSGTVTSNMETFEVPSPASGTFTFNTVTIS